jgi:tight adherence protein B
VILLLAAVFIAALALFVGGYVLVNRRSLAAAGVARSRLTAGQTFDKSWNLLRDERVSTVPFLDRLLSGKTWIERLRLGLDQAGTTIRPATFLMLTVSSGLAGTLIGGRITDGIFTLPFAAAGWAAPFIWLRRRRRQRLAAFEAQLPDAIDMLVAAMKAGYSFQAATQFIGEELRDPLGPEFARFYDEQRLGIEVRTALLSMQDRVDSLDLKMFVTAVLIQRETGGSLAEVLESLSDLIRQRIAMRGHIETLVAEPKMSARFLAVMPVLVFLVLGALNPAFMAPLTQEQAGRFILAGAAVSVVAGYIVMMKIADVDI